MQDKILLGFLMSGPKTGYEIKKLMETSTDFFFSTSFGSIYPAFKKLEKAGLVKVNEMQENGKLKKKYTINQSGKKDFTLWLETSPEISRIRDEALLKIFFHSHISTEAREIQLNEYLVKLQAQIEKLSSLWDKLLKLDVDRFNMQSLEFGIDYYKFISKKVKELIRQNASE